MATKDTPTRNAHEESEETMKKAKKKHDGRTLEGRLHLMRSDAAKRAWVTIRANRAKAKKAARTS